LDQGMLTIVIIRNRKIDGQEREDNRKK